MDLSNKALRVGAVTTIHQKGYKFSTEKRIELVSRWLVLGNLRQAAAMCGVSYQLAQKWKTTDWWKDLVLEIQAARKMKTDNKLSKIVNKALDLIEDRLDNGDFIHNQKTGEVFRKPVSIKEARGAANDLMQRQVALSKLEIEEKSSNSASTIADQLTFLKEQFAAFNTTRTLEVVPNALHEERKTGLQTGERAVQQPTRTSEGPDGTQPSESDDGESGFGFEGGWEGRGPQEASEQGWDEFDDEPESSEQDSQPELFEEFERISKESNE